MLLKKKKKKKKKKKYLEDWRPSYEQEFHWQNV